MTRRVILTALASLLAAGSSLPAQAAPVPPLASEVTLSTHTVTVGSKAGKDLSTYPAVVHVTGVSTAVAQAMAGAITTKGRGLVRPRGQAAHTAVDVRAVVAEADRSYISVVFVSSYYQAGAAHPIAVPDTLVFLRATGAVLGFTDIFADPVRALPVLAGEVKRNARYALGPGYDRSAVGLGVDKPTVQSLGRLVPRPWGLEVFFAQGDLAANVFGPTSVLVPWDVLKPLLKVSLPTLGGNVPSPAYGGGEAITDKVLLTALARGIQQGGRQHVRGLSGRTPASYRLIDARTVSAYVTSDDTEELYVVTLVPFATPAKSLAVLVALGGDEGNPSFDIVDVQHGAVGCGIVSSAFIKALKEKCP